MKTLYFDCFAGASGNMILGALVALGVEREKLVAELKKLYVEGWEIEFSIRDKSGISAVHADVKVPHEHAHRHLHHIEQIIRDSDLSEAIKTRSIAIFTRLAEAEAKVHGIDVKKVHFHEVGAMDAIIDVVGACVGFEMLGIEKFVCSPIHAGSGFVEMEHGKFPVPPPAVAELLRNAPVYSTEIQGELITPTGAAIIAAICESFGPMPEMTIEKTAYGAGTRDYDKFPNVLRLILGTTSEKNVRTENARFSLENRKPKTENLILIESNIDDLSPQILGFVMDRAFEKGALDCWFTPIQMKKNRPATMVSILCTKEAKAALIELLYTETTTLGVRVREVERECLDRETVSIETGAGTVDFKIARHGEKIMNVKPEYDHLREIALKSNISMLEAEKITRRIFENEFERNEIGKIETEEES